MTLYTFHRFIDGEEFFYPLDLRDDKDAVANAKHNPGTLYVCDIHGHIVWREEH